MFRQLSRFSSYVSFKDFTFWRITLVSSTSMFLWIFISLKPKLAVQLFTKKNEKTRPSMTCKRFILFSLLRISGKICELKNSEKDRGKLVLHACIFCLLLLLPEEFSIRRHSSTRAIIQSQFLFLFELIHYEELVLNVSTGYAHNLPEVFLLNHKVICKEFVRQ